MNNKRIILSPIIAADSIDEWQNRGLLIPHEIIRRALNTIIELTDTKYYNNPNIKTLKDTIGVFFKWYNEMFYFFVHHHHDIEENIYFKWVEERCQTLPKKLSKDHENLIKMLNDIKYLQNKFKDNVSTKEQFEETLQDLHKKCMELKDDMNEHLNEEEQTIPNLLKKHNVTEKEEKIIIDKIIKGLGLSGNKIMLPWIIDVMHQWGGADTTKHFLTSIPAPIRFLNHFFWTSHYNKRNKNIITTISSVC